MRRAAERVKPELRLRDAIVLGLLHGPAELLPISSSGHVAVVPWLLDWPYQRLDSELRKAFEVALHAGTAAALIVGLRAEVYLAVGGFPGLALDEDVSMVTRLGGYRVVRSGSIPVVTSARATGRLSGGFADHVAALG